MSIQNQRSMMSVSESKVVKISNKSTSGFGVASIPNKDVIAGPTDYYNKKRKTYSGPMLYVDPLTKEESQLCVIMTGKSLFNVTKNPEYENSKARVIFPLRNKTMDERVLENSLIELGDRTCESMVTHELQVKSKTRKSKMWSGAINTEMLKMISEFVPFKTTTKYGNQVSVTVCEGKKGAIVKMGKTNVKYTDMTKYSTIRARVLVGWCVTGGKLSLTYDGVKFWIDDYQQAMVTPENIESQLTCDLLDLNTDIVHVRAPVSSVEDGKILKIATRSAVSTDVIPKNLVMCMKSRLAFGLKRFETNGKSIQATFRLPKGSAEHKKVSELDSAIVGGSFSHKASLWKWGSSDKVDPLDIINSDKRDENPDYKISIMRMGKTLDDGSKFDDMFPVGVFERNFENSDYAHKMATFVERGVDGVERPKHFSEFEKGCLVEVWLCPIHTWVKNQTMSFKVTGYKFVYLEKSKAGGSSKHDVDEYDSDDEGDDNFMAAAYPALLPPTTVSSSNMHSLGQSVNMELDTSTTTVASVESQAVAVAEQEPTSSADGDKRKDFGVDEEDADVHSAKKRKTLDPAQEQDF